MEMLLLPRRGVYGTDTTAFTRMQITDLQRGRCLRERDRFSSSLPVMNPDVRGCPKAGEQDLF